MSAARRLPPVRQRVEQLKAAGWTRTSSSGAQSWREPGDPRTAWTLAAAYRKLTGLWPDKPRSDEGDPR